MEKKEWELIETVEYSLPRKTFDFIFRSVLFPDIVTITIHASSEEIAWKVLSETVK